MNKESPLLDAQDFARWWSQTGEHELRQVLYWKWDPIGVNFAFPNTADEYDAYAPEVVSALRNGASEEQVLDLLKTIEHKRIGLNRDRTDELRSLVSDITTWFAQSQRSWTNFGPVRR